jgi:hypothetical protein
VFHRGDSPDDLISPTFAETQRFVGEGRFVRAADDPDDLIGPHFATPAR